MKDYLLLGTEGGSIMSDQTLIPMTGTLRPLTYPDPEPGDPEVLFDFEIPVRIVLTSAVEEEFYPRRQPSVSLEDVDLGVSNWQQLAGKDIVFPPEMDTSDACIYLASLHNPVRLHRLCFGEVNGNTIHAWIDLEFDFRCVNPRPPELERMFRVHWEIDFEVVK